MAIDIKFDLVGNPEPPTIILANRNGNQLGQLKVNTESITLSDKLNDASELSFTVNKYIDNEPTPLWDKLVDFKLVYCKEWDEWFEATVELDEETETVKTVFCTQLGQAELSQIMLYDIEINTEDDIARDDYKTAILYDLDDPEASILDRLLKDKAPHYSIAHVSPTIANKVRSFSFDGTSIYDAFQEIAEEIGCLFQFHVGTDENGVLQRKISVYDLQQYCEDCSYRGEFTSKCPKCGSTNITNGYGEDTLIFVTSDELALEGIELVTDTDSVKNCFKLEAGDDLMTATIRNCNPNGTDYIWYFSDDVKEDMSDKLVEKIESYDELYKQYYKEYVSNLDTELVEKYNALVDKYSAYNEDLQKIFSPITGYSALMNAYYNAVDMALYLKSELMPSIEMSETSAEEQVGLLTAASLSPVAVNVEDIANTSLATANSAVLTMAKVLVKSTYKVEIKTSTLSVNKVDDKVVEQVWKGEFVVTNYSDDEDAATSNTITVIINNDTEEFVKQKIEKALNKEDTDDYSISGLFKREYDDFCAELKKYGLNPLKSLNDACTTCIDILIEQGASDKEEKPDLYKALYEPYYNKSVAITNEMKIREDEVAIINGVYDNTDDGETVLITDGLLADIEDNRDAIQEALNFKNYLGEDLWIEFCAYRREDKYSNDNYVSDGLTNSELFERAQRFIEVAENEIYKSAELQHSISTTLNNLLAIPKFRPLVNSFKVGNWIRVQIDGEIYKLRLLEYDIDFGSFDNISVEFSDVYKIKSGITDVKSVLSQASSMATSYSSIQKQAEKGDRAKTTLEKWIEDGLNSASIRIQNNNSEEMTMTRNGLLCRSYDDITQTYSPEQFKITHNIMAYTNDEWRTVRQAIGKHDYVIYDEKTNGFVDKTGYGMTADFVTAGIVSGSQIIGGDIYSNNYSVNNGTGSHLNLIDGTFSFGGGSLRYEDGKLIISSRVADSNITEINEEWLKTTSVYAENLNVNAAKVMGKLTAAEIDAGNITSGTLTGRDIYGGSLLIGDKDSDCYAEIDTSGKLTCTGVDITGVINAKKGGTIAGFTIDDYTIYNGTLGSDNSVFLSTTDMNGVFGFFGDDIANWRMTIGNNFGVTSDGSLYVNNANIVGTIVGSEIAGSTITGSEIIGESTLKVGNDGEGGYLTWIGEDGIFHAQGAVIDGELHVVNGGTIGGWNVDDYGIVSTNGTTVLYSGNEDDYRMPSLVGGNSTSPIRFAAGWKNEKPIRTVEQKIEIGNYSIGAVCHVDHTIDNCREIIEVSTAVSAGSVGLCKYEITGQDSARISFVPISSTGTITVTYTYLYDGFVSAILEDGSLYANNANITGSIRADNGYIGGIKIMSDGLGCYNGDNLLYVLNEFGLTLTKNTAQICVGDLSIGYDTTEKSTIIETSGHLVIRGDNSTQLEFMKETGSTSETYNVILHYYAQPNYGFMGLRTSYTVYVWLTTDTNPKYPQRLLIQWEDNEWADSGGNSGNSGGTNLTIPNDGSCISETKSFDISPSNDATFNIEASGYSWHYDLEPSSTETTLSFLSFSQTSSPNNLYITGNLVPSASSYDLGGYSDYWNNIYCQTSAIDLSDKNKKNTIQQLSNHYERIFDSLKPVSYKFNDNTSDRTHIGFVAQDVKESIESSGLTTQDFAAYCEWENDDGTIGCGLRYSELIALCVDEIQKLKSRVAQLEENNKK